MMHDGYSGWMLGGMWIFTLLFWILVIASVVCLVNWLRRRNTRESALDLLKKRYARGEIDQEAFERMKKDVEAGSE
ncbi:MAG: SHOCT domain-containing protein [Methylotenera sp.]